MCKGMTSFLTFAVTSLRVSSDIPVQSDYLPLITLYMILSIFYTFIGFYMFYFYFLILPMVLYAAFIYSWFDKRDFVLVDFKKRKISKLESLYIVKRPNKHNFYLIE